MLMIVDISLYAVCMILGMGQICVNQAKNI